MDSKKKTKAIVVKDNWGLNFFVILLCLAGAAYSIHLFYISMFQTIQTNAEPIGTVVVKENTVQRRLQQRVLWDRLYSESPVYMGDIIRVAKQSRAELHLTDRKSVV